MAQTVEYYQQKLRRAQADLNFARSTNDPDTIRVFTARFLAAQNDLDSAQLALEGVRPANAVDPAVSPAAAQADANAEEEVGFFGRLFGTADTDEDVGEFAEYGSDLSAPPPLPTPTPAPAQQEEVDLNLFAEGGDVADIGESRIIRDPESAEAVDNAIQAVEDVGTGVARAFSPLEIPDDQAIDEFTSVVVTEDGTIVAEDPNVVEGFEEQTRPLVTPTPVDDNQAKEQQIVPDIEIQVPNPDPIAQERPAQINNAALERLKAQSAIQQSREPEAPGDWRVKLRLASGASYFYKQAGVAGAGILKPLLDTDGIIFPYTPRIDIVYSAEYNPYHPTHSNYQHYFYKGSRVGEVVMTAEFTAQDTQEANYLLAVIHFLKSASKMFYGQDPDRGSPPPLLFLSGLGDYQFNEAPCVISQFNYNLPGDVDYIRANVEQINGNTETLQYNLRQKNTAGSSTVLSSRLNRLLGNLLNEGAEPNIPGTVARLDSQEATYVPTKMTMTITMLPVQNRLQVSSEFSLRDYANGKLITRGYW